MKRVSQWKKTGSGFTPAWVALALFGVVAGGVVLPGCGGDAEDEDTPTNTPAKDDVGED